MCFFYKKLKFRKIYPTSFLEVYGSRRCGWDWVPLERVAGGIISIWKEEMFGLEETKMQSYLAIKLSSTLDGFVCAVANVYDPIEDFSRDSFGTNLSSVM